MAIKIAELQTSNFLMDLEEDEQRNLVGGTATPGVLQDIYYDIDGDGIFDYHEVIGIQDDGRVTDKIFSFSDHSLVHSETIGIEIDGPVIILFP